MEIHVLPDKKFRIIILKKLNEIQENTDKQVNKSVTSNKEGHYIVTKVSIHQGNITIMNIYAPNVGAPKYLKQILTTKGRSRQQCSNVRELQYPLPTLDRSSRQKINKEIVNLNNTTDQMEDIMLSDTM